MGSCPFVVLCVGLHSGAPGARKGFFRAMLSPSDIRPAVEAILRTTDSGLTTYEILDQLPAGLRHQIITERGMPGLGSGNSYSAASLVADAIEGLLPSLEPPYRVYVHGQAVFTVAVQEIRPGNSAIAL